MKIVSVSAEIAPFSKTGGLAEVAKSLPAALYDIGHDIISVTPFHAGIDGSEMKNIGNLDVAYGDKKIKFDIWESLINGRLVFFLENDKYFTQPRSIYLTGFDNERFLVFALATIELLKKIGFKADIIQCHDWHAGLIPYFLKHDYKDDEFFKKTATVFTIHNLAFQFEKNWWETCADCKDDGISKIPFLGDKKLGCINFALRAIVNADIINTVSENYAKEILTNEFGENLEIQLRSRRDDVFGIINGIDYESYNPATDPGLKSNYDYRRIENKILNKVELQRISGLPLNKEVPVIGMVSRITEQKGMDLIIKILDYVLDYPVQVVIMGIGDKEYERIFNSIFKEKYKNFSFLPFDQKRETLVYAGSDLYLMPSRFEPCGLGQIISLRYGSVPIVRKVGGLADTIEDFNPITGEGTGFVFEKYDPMYLFGAIVRGLVNYRHKQAWKRLVARAMKKSFSWELPAEKYVSLFKKAIKNKKTFNQKKS
jgi:starch synthase